MHPTHWTHHTYTCIPMHMYTCTHIHTHTSVFGAQSQLMKMACLLNYLFVSIVAFTFYLLVLLFFKILLFQISVKCPQGTSCMLQSHWLRTHIYTEGFPESLQNSHHQGTGSGPLLSARIVSFCLYSAQSHAGHKNYFVRVIWSAAKGVQGCNCGITLPAQSPRDPGAGVHPHCSDHSFCSITIPLKQPL